MKIESVETHLLEVPLERPIVAAANRRTPGSASKTIFMPVVFLKTDENVTGMGYAWSVVLGGKTMLSALQNDLADMLVGQDPLDHERLWKELYWKTQTIGRHGLITQAISAIDMALWDVKGKVSGLPLFKLLGGIRESAPVYGSDGGWLNMSVDEMLTCARKYLDQGMRGVKIKVGHDDPRIDVARVREIRQNLGDDVWIAVDANQKWDFPTALRIGREFEQLGCAWFEEPMICEDVAGHTRLAEKLNIPIALGETLGSRFEIDAYLRADAVDVLQPDVCHVGGITEFLKIAALASVTNRPVEPHLMMDVCVHLACGIPGVAGLEYMPWLSPAFASPPKLEEGRLIAPQTPGLGLEISTKAMEKYRVA